MPKWTFMQWVVAVILIAAAVAIVLIALPAMGIPLPSWAVDIFWVVVIAFVAIAAIGLLVKLWKGWGGSPIIVISLVFSVSSTSAQTIQVETGFPAMPVLKLRPGLWEGQKVVADVTITWPDDSTYTYYPTPLKAVRVVRGDAVIEATLVRGLFFRAVDACVLEGEIDTGVWLKMQLPREPVTTFGVALAIDCTGALTDNGKVYRLAVHIPDCKTRFIRGTGFTQRLAEPVTGRGTAIHP